MSDQREGQGPGVWRVYVQDAVGVLVGDVDQLEERLVLEQRLPHTNQDASSGNHVSNVGDIRGNDWPDASGEKCS